MNSTIKPKPCKTCGNIYHSAMWHKPRTAIKVNKPLPRPTKPINMKGRHRDAWSRIKIAWFEQYGSYHPCHYFGIGLKPETITLDHKIPRSRAPELRYDFGNLVPACFTCNGLKGSVDHDHYKHVCH